MLPRPLLFGVVSGLLVGIVVDLVWFGWLAGGTDTTALVERMGAAGLGGPVAFWAFAAWMCLGNSLLEEFVFRWFVDGRLNLLGVPTVVALPISAMIFTFHHVIVLAAYFDALVIGIGSVGVFLGGLIWSAGLRRWGSLVPIWLSHAIVDVALVLIAAHVLCFWS